MNETITNIPLGELHPFPDHPFGVRDDEAMEQTVGSIREYGVLVPAIARPREEGGYELIAGHRRKHACELAGLETMPVIVRDLDRNAAVIIMVDSNIQRENILPSERAKAYKMKLEAIKRQGERTDLTSSPLDKKLKGLTSAQQVSQNEWRQSATDLSLYPPDRADPTDAGHGGQRQDRFPPRRRAFLPLQKNSSRAYMTRWSARTARRRLHRPSK